MANLMSPFVGKGVRLSKVEWDGPRQMLRHTVATMVTALPEEHELQNVAFMYAAFESLPSLPGWSRVSIEGYVHTSSETTPSPRHQNKWIREITVSDFQSQGVKVRLVSGDKDATHFLDKQSDTHVQLNYAKVNVTSGSVFADVNDLTSIVQSDESFVGESLCWREFCWREFCWREFCWRKFCWSSGLKIVTGKLFRNTSLT